MSTADQTNYDVIRRRLTAAAEDLTGTLEGLNAERKQVFGGSDIQVAGNERVRTEHNCVPRDIVTIGDLLLFGYNVFIGLKPETTVADVFGLHRFEQTEGGYDCSAVPLDSAGGFLTDPQFVKDFGNLYRYYREAQLLQLVTSDTQLLAVFQSGASHRETKVFRWNIGKSGHLSYVDDRGERDYEFSRSHDFRWTPITRDHQIAGRFPHYSVEDEVFVDILSGSLTIKVENNTETGAGIYTEPVDDPNQVLDDGQFFYAALGSLLVLKILPFRETTWRYLVFDRRHRTVARIDAIGQAGLQLPEDHGLVFPGGYYLQSGEHKVFDADTSDLEFVRSLKAPNGEDVVYVFHRRSDGHYSLLFYNLIRKEVQTPIECHGYSLFADGRMVVFRALSDEPTRVHPMQVWSTPFSSVEFAASIPTDDSFLARVGNAELVRGISDAFSVVRLAKISEPSRETFEEIVSSSVRLRDNFFWLADTSLEGLSTAIASVGRSAEQIVDEFEKVVALRQRATAALAESEEQVAELERSLAAEAWSQIDPFLGALTTLRRQRGHLITLRDVRYVDLEAIDGFEKRVVDMFDRVSRDAVSFLLRDDAFTPLNDELKTTMGELESADKVAQVAPLRDRIEATAEGLSLLGEVMANIEIDDVTQRTTILERITEVFSHVNAGRATIDGRHRELLAREGKAEFSAQLLLLSQTMSSSLAMCDTPESCDEQMARVIVSLEELESRFSDVDEFVAELTDKREDIAEAFSARKQLLLETRQRRAQTLLVAADRILDGVARRARVLESADDLNGFFAADAMVMKLRNLNKELAALGDTVKADELASRLLSAKQNALRAVRDKVDLFDNAKGLIRFGSHSFSVNTQPLDLTLVPRGGGMELHLAGTDFYEAIDDEDFESTRETWSQLLVSESDDVYRGEYLAHQVLEAAERGEGPSVAALAADDELIKRTVTAYSLERYDEGYERGIHDRDGAAILGRLVHAHQTVGLLRYPGDVRSLATLFWVAAAPELRDHWRRMAQSRGRLRDRLGVADALAPLAIQLSTRIGEFVAEGLGPFGPELADMAGRYLAVELTAAETRFVASAAAEKLRVDLTNELELQGLRTAFEDDLRALESRPLEKFELASAWLEGHLAKTGETSVGVVEAATIVCTPTLARTTSSAQTELLLNGLLGHHSRIKDRKLLLRVDEFLARLERFSQVSVPAFRDYRKKRTALIERENHRLRPEELKPRVMTSFVRNQLISDVYLPLIGDNLAKQIGAAGAAKRTDLMGLLLLISPPGYGKTTLMEYVADRLGLAFVKINGPSIGHAVHSLDPDEAPNATARSEVEKINLALEMGNNVMLYLDDIQHTHPELLQKFISLCDAQRRIEGVWKGRTRTYDLRGKKFCVVMAGNPYTESGESFQVPDMLSNRADVYNLGDVLFGREKMFAKSYIENAMTSNAALAPLAMRDPGDIDKLIAMSQGEPIAGTQLSHGYSQVEIDEITAVLGHMFRVQEVLLSVNQLYIKSAAQDDTFRVEPPFKLQGSYRNMNKLAEKLASAMTDDEVDELIDDHYTGEAQTLTTESEFNLLKLAQMRGRLTEAQRARYDEIVGEFRRQHRLGGGDADPVTRVTATLDSVRESLDSIRAALGAGSKVEIGEDIRGIVESLSRKVEVTIENQPPPGVSEILAQQVKLVERTLVPVVEAATKSLHDGQAFAQQLVQIFEMLQNLDHKLG